MKLIISDDYQGAVSGLQAFAGLQDWDVAVYRDTVSELDALAARFADADAALLIRERTRFPRALLERLPRLKFISQTGRAASHVDIAAATELGIPVAAEGSATNAAAELTWALVMAQMRRVRDEANRLSAGQWQGHLGRSLKGRTLGIAGYGQIGSLVAGYGRAFGMDVVVWADHSSSADAAGRDGVRVEADRERFFAQCDVLCCHLRLVPATRGLVTQADLQRMKPDALFVNTSRAEVVADGALATALQSGRPGFAAVDVYEHEPIFDADHELIALPTVLATPHIGYVELDTYEHYFGHAVAQLQAWKRDERLNVLNPDVWPRRRR
jgi:D-3-phosphoglycerate dehydrogenase / 2-oxoglutarate reductase